MRASNLIVVPLVVLCAAVASGTEAGLETATPGPSTAVPGATGTAETTTEPVAEVTVEPGGFYEPGPADARIVLTDYQGNLEFREGSRIEANGPAPCEFLIEFDERQRQELQDSGQTTITVPVLCNSLILYHFELARRPLPDGGLEERVDEFSFPLTRDGLIYRSPSLEPRPTGGFAGPPPSGLPSTGRAGGPGSTALLISGVLAAVAIALLVGGRSVRPRKQ